MVIFLYFLKDDVAVIFHSEPFSCLIFSYVYLGTDALHKHDNEDENTDYLIFIGCLLSHRCLKICFFVKTILK